MCLEMTMRLKMEQVFSGSLISAYFIFLIFHCEVCSSTKLIYKGPLKKYVRSAGGRVPKKAYGTMQRVRSKNTHAHVMSRTNYLQIILNK